MKTNCNVGDGFNPSQLMGGGGAGKMQEEEAQGTITKLVLDMCAPLKQPGRVLNMDNYYTSPVVFMELKKRNIYAQGTCCEGCLMFPEMVQFSKADARKFKCGAMKFATCKEHQMVTIGWVDGNPVRPLPTADVIARRRKSNHWSQFAIIITGCKRSTTSINWFCYIL